MLLMAESAGGSFNSSYGKDLCFYVMLGKCSRVFLAEERGTEVDVPVSRKGRGSIGLSGPESQRD